MAPIAAPIVTSSTCAIQVEWDSVDGADEYTVTASSGSQVTTTDTSLLVTGKYGSFAVHL